MSRVAKGKSSKALLRRSLRASVVTPFGRKVAMEVQEAGQDSGSGMGICCSPCSTSIGVCSLIDFWSSGCCFLVSPVLQLM